MPEVGGGVLPAHIGMVDGVTFQVDKAAVAPFFQFVPAVLGGAHLTIVMNPGGENKEDGFEVILFKKGKDEGTKVVAGIATEVKGENNRLFG